ncbi:PspC domain-containing protein [Tissierella creatinophila]|uniref:PspC domain-containing protein n=1 Tax=Tissierella creatinophila TaxID=79681 RepID=UPI0038CD5AA0
MRSKSDKVFSGVLGGIGEYFNINTLFLRIIYTVLAINAFLTLTIIYIVLSAIIPLEDDIIEEDSSSNYSTNNSSFLGISLIVLGIILLINTFLPVHFPQILSIIKYYSRKLIDFWPVLLIILGIYLLMDKNKIKNSLR